MCVEKPKFIGPWYRHPVGAVVIGAIIAVVLAVPCLAYGISYLGAEALLLATLIAPAVSGFVVGSLCPTNGAALGVVSTVPPILIALLRYIPGGLDDLNPAANPGVIPFLAMTALVSAVFGGLGASTAQMPRRTRIFVTAIVIATFPLIAGICGLQSKREMDCFRKEVLQVVQQRFGEQVIRLDPRTEWILRRLRLSFAGTHVVQATTRIKGHELSIVTSSTGERISRCRYGYEPATPVSLSDEKAVRRYLADFGVSETALRRLSVRDRPQLVARSWFCGNALLPKPSVRPCTDRSRCDTDYLIEVVGDGTIRIRRLFFAAEGRPMR